MKEFGNINTSLPYRESAATVDAIVERRAEAALQKGRSDWSRHLVYSLAGVAAAAAIVLAVVIPSGSIFYKPAESPIESFLASITDSEAAMIVDPQIDDIPEYY